MVDAQEPFVRLPRLSGFLTRHSKEALQVIAAMHRVVPVPAYNLEGILIPLQSYCKRLQGAIVELHFTLTHWSIGGKPGQEKVDQFTADLYSMCMLLPPNPPLFHLANARPWPLIQCHLAPKRHAFCCISMHPFADELEPSCSLHDVTLQSHSKYCT
jgi:hypothetical protein